MIGLHPDGPAAAAGVMKNDLVYRADDRPIRSRSDLNAYLATLKPGVTIRLSLYRDVQHMELRLRSRSIPTDVAQRVINKTLGISLSVQNGELVVTKASPNGGWAHANLRVGDRIVAVNGERVNSLDSLYGALNSAKAAHRPSALFTVRRGRGQGTLTLPI